MSQVFHGVVLRSSEPEARAVFATLDFRVPLRLVRLDDEVFGIYARRRADAFPGDLDGFPPVGAHPGELQRIAAQVSLATRAALFSWYDSRVGSRDQLFQRGLMTREWKPDDSFRDTWGKGHPREVIGVRGSLHHVVEEAFLDDTLEPLAAKHPS